jgi:hypothetical protein
MKRVWLGEITNSQRTRATTRLTTNSERQPFRGRFIWASIGKGLRAPRPLSHSWRARWRRRLRHLPGATSPLRAATSQTLCAGRAIQLTRRLGSNPERNPFMNWRWELTPAAPRARAERQESENAALGDTAMDAAELPLPSASMSAPGADQMGMDGSHWPCRTWPNSHAARARSADLCTRGLAIGGRKGVFRLSTGTAAPWRRSRVWRRQRR